MSSTTNSNNNSGGIPLTTWINSALNSIANNTYSQSPPQQQQGISNKINSTIYTSAALSIAQSLICQLNLSYANSGNGRQELILPKDVSNWTDQIVIHLNTNNNSISDELQPIGLTESIIGNNSSTTTTNNNKDTELKSMLDSLINRRTSVEESMSDNNGERISAEPMLNVSRAEIIPTQNSQQVKCSSKDENKHLYSLGIVLYQLFSGGTIIIPEKKEILNKLVKYAQLKQKEAYEKLSESERVRNYQAGFFTELNVQDHDIDNEIGDLFGDIDQNEPPPPILNNNGEETIAVNVVEVEEEEDGEEQRRSRKKGPSINNNNGSSSSASNNTNSSTTIITDLINQLKVLGIPTSLCNLIHNMIDSIHGDLSGNEAYKSMSDVQTDIQLLIDQPTKYLYDVNIDKLAVSGLQLDGYELGRDLEFGILQSSYRRSISISTSTTPNQNSNECGIIVGPSGIGKSVLANRLGNSISSTGGLFLSGKFDQMQQPTPFSALASAFNDYCDKMFQDGRAVPLELVASQLRKVLGTDGRYLTKVIPKLSVILGQSTELEQDEAQDCVDAQKRLQYLLCQFVDVIASCSGAPIVLFLDDVQWADPASINVVNQLLLSSGSSTSSESSSSSSSSRQFYFLASCRDEGMLPGHPFMDMLASVQTFGVKANVITLTCMDREMINMMISDLLCLFPRLTWSLSEIIHHKTNGNPLFFAQLMMSLCRDGLVRLSLSKRRWEWDEEKIQSTKLPDDVATFLSISIKRLPQEVQDALFTLSCFGSSSPCDLINALEAKVSKKLVESLELAVKAGLVDKINDSYVFGHDWIQEAAYNTVQPQDRVLFHFKYGVSLVPQALEIQDNSMLFTAANQINIGGPAAVENPDQGNLVANLNLTASLKAMEMSDFVSAHAFADHGISFLRKRHWQEHYNLSLHLFEAASKCALVTGDVVGLKLLSDQIQRYAKNFQDKLNSLYYNVIALAFASQLPESANRSVLVLSQLGEDMPESYSETEMKFHIEQTKILLQGYTEQELIDYRMCDDEAKIMAMKFYARLELTFQMIKPASQPIVTLKMVQLSIAQGMTPVSPMGFVYFGQLLARLGYIQDGCRYVKIARKMLNKFGTKEVAGEVIAVGTQILCFVEPIQATVESHIDGRSIAMVAGDVHGACLNSILYVATMFWSGTKLQTCRDHFRSAIRVLEQKQHLTWASHIIVMKQWFHLLMGSQQDAGLPEEASPMSVAFEQAAQAMQTTNPHATMTYYFQSMYLYYVLRDYDQMKICADKVFEFDLHSWTLLAIHQAHSFYRGLVSFWIYRQTLDPVWAQRGQKAKHAIQKWAESASQHNFQHKLYMLQAEEAFCNNDFVSAKSFYEQAVAAAKKHRFINEEALACELAGHFFLKVGDNETAIQYFLQAHEKYHEWGAVAKSNLIFEFVQKNLAASISPSPSNLPSHSIEEDTNRRKRGAD